MNEPFSLSPASNAWPFLFKYRGPVLGQGYVAVVEFHGRLLGRPDGDKGELWIDGVNPGGFAFGATNLRMVSLELKSTLTGILVDIAEEADTFESFKAGVERFFGETDLTTQGEWEACVVEVQRGRLTSPGILPVLAANQPLLVEVTLKPTEAITPKDNSAPEPVLASVA